MTVAAPPRPPERKSADADALEALIEEARRRARRRRFGYAACTLAALAGVAISFGLRSGGGNTVPSSQEEASAELNARAAPTHRGSLGFIAVARVYRGESHILLVDPSGRRAPRDLGPGGAPSWSPDGRKLVFEYDISRGGRSLPRLFVMNADGSGRHLLSTPPVASERFEDWAPAWSPDGSRIAFTRTVHTGSSADFGRSAIYVLDLVHRGLRRVSSLSENGAAPLGATWSPDGRRLAYLGESGQSYIAGGFGHGCLNLHVTNADGTHDHVLAAASRVSDGCISIWSPAWSPDGQSIAFARSTKHFGGGMDLYLISSNGKHLRRLTHQPNLVNSGPSWSADGKRIAFSSGRRDRPGPGTGGPNQIRTLLVIDQDGSNLHTVIRFRGHISGGPAW